MNFSINIIDGKNSLWHHDESPPHLLTLCCLAPPAYVPSKLQDMLCGVEWRKVKGEGEEGESVVRNTDEAIIY